MLEEPAHFIMISNERETDFVFRAPEKNTLVESRANFPHRSTQLSQTKPSRKRFGIHRSDKKVNASFDLQLLNGIESFEAAFKGAVERIAQLQTPEVLQGSFFGAKGSSAHTPSRALCKKSDIFIREIAIGDDLHFSQRDPTSLNDESHCSPFSCNCQSLLDGLRQLDFPIGFDISRNDFKSHELPLVLGGGGSLSPTRLSR